MIPCNCCKHETSRDETSPRRDVRDESPRSPSEQLLGLPLPSPRRVAVEPRRWQRARSATRSPRHTLDCKAACQAPHGAETRPAGGDESRWAHGVRAANASPAVDRRGGGAPAR